MAIEYKDDWLAGFRDSINSLTNLKMTQKQIANDERKEAFNQQTTLAKMKQDETNQIVNANVGLSNAFLGIGKAEGEYRTAMNTLSSKRDEIMRSEGLDPLNAAHVKAFSTNPKYIRYRAGLKTLEDSIVNAQDNIAKTNAMYTSLKSLIEKAYPSSGVQSTSSNIKPTFP